VKRRLAVDLDGNLVVELYKNFILDLLETLEELDVPFCICFFPEQAQQKFCKWLGADYRFVAQKGNDLGERMKNSFVSAFSRGFQRVVLIGSDSPDLPCELLRKAFVALRTHEVVLGPSFDGGYYLIGFRDDTFLPLVFEGISWGSTTVFQSTMEGIKNAGCNVSLLPAWGDVDTIADVKNLVRRNHNTAFKSSHTISFLRRNKTLLEDNDVTMPKM
jgi:rSAM/selenodomain-associated transferase 1